MKKFILAALAASVIATPVLAAPYDRHDDRGRVEQRHDNDRRDNGRYDKQVRKQQQIQYRNWKKGDRFDSRYSRNYRVVSNPYAYRLRPAPRGYRWVQSGNDAVLIGITSGIVASVMANLIR